MRERGRERERERERESEKEREREGEGEGERGREMMTSVISLYFLSPNFIHFKIMVEDEPTV